MDGIHPENIDPQPKRRKDQGNPYQIFTVGIHTAHPRYYLSFVDSEGVKQCIEVSKALFDTFDRFELDDLSFLNEVDKHYEHSELTDASLNARAAIEPESVEEIAMQHLQNERLHHGIAALPEKQRQRLILYYFGGLTYEQIAEVEGCQHQTVQESVCAALKNLKKFLK